MHRRPYTDWTVCQCNSATIEMCDPFNQNGSTQIFLTTGPIHPTNEILSHPRLWPPNSGLNLWLINNSSSREQPSRPPSLPKPNSCCWWWCIFCNLFNFVFRCFINCGLRGSSGVQSSHHTQTQTPKPPRTPLIWDTAHCVWTFLKRAKMRKDAWISQRVRASAMVASLLRPFLARAFPFGCGTPRHTAATKIRVKVARFHHHHRPRCGVSFLFLVPIYIYLFIFYLLSERVVLRYWSTGSRAPAALLGGANM